MLLLSLSTVMVMVILGYIHPLSDIDSNQRSLRAELVILFFIDLVLCSSDPRINGRGRLWIGWTVIFLLGLVIAVS